MTKWIKMGSDSLKNKAITDDTDGTDVEMKSIGGQVATHPVSSVVLIFGYNGDSSAYHK